MSDTLEDTRIYILEQMADYRSFGRYNGLINVGIIRRGDSSAL